MDKITSRQVIEDYAEGREVFGFKSEMGLEDYMALKDDVKQLLDIVNNLSPIKGSGSPEGVVESNYSQVYIDATNEPVSVTMYFNSSVGEKTGWVQVV